MTHYNRLSAADKEAVQRDRMREPAVVCRYCETRTTVADMLKHLAERYPGRPPVHTRSRWVTWGQALELGVTRSSLGRWARNGSVLVSGERRLRRYLQRDITKKLMNTRPPSPTGGTPGGLTDNEVYTGILTDNEKRDPSAAMGHDSTTRFLSTRQLADRVGVSEATLKLWRRERRGPAHFKAGRRVLYDWRDVEEWFQACREGAA